jgi:hypothetical protein
MRQRRWFELIKDYELEVHYHLGKTNIIADALSRKAHCNYLLAVRLTEGEFSTRVLPNLSLFNITLTSTFGILNFIQKVKLLLVFQDIDLQNLANFGHREGHQFELQNLCWF